MMSVVFVVVIIVAVQMNAVCHMAITALVLMNAAYPMVIIPHVQTAMTYQMVLQLKMNAVYVMAQVLCMNVAVRVFL